jgi:hypothetical protein
MYVAALHESGAGPLLDKSKRQGLPPRNVGGCLEEVRREYDGRVGAAPLDPAVR